MKDGTTRLGLFAAPTGAIGLGALAALLGACCGAPWLVAAIGVGGAIALARLALFAPILWLAGFGAAAALLIRAYRADPSCDQTCAPVLRRTRRVSAWLVALTLLGLFVAFRGWLSIRFLIR